MRAGLRYQNNTNSTIPYRSPCVAWRIILRALCEWDFNTSGGVYTENRPASGGNSFTPVFVKGVEGTLRLRASYTDT